MFDCKRASRKAKSHMVQFILDQVSLPAKGIFLAGDESNSVGAL
jgi:hypothetical protein